MRAVQSDWQLVMRSDSNGGQKLQVPYILAEKSDVLRLALKSQVVIFGDFDAEVLGKGLVIAANQSNVIFSGNKSNQTNL